MSDCLENAKGAGLRQEMLERFRRDDPVAAQTEWGPVSQGGASFRTHVLVQVSPSRVEFHPTGQGRLIPILFLLAGLGALAFGAYGLVSDIGAGAFIILWLVVGCMFAGTGGAVYWFMTRRVAFDRQAGCFWKGGPTPKRFSVPDAEFGKNAVPFAEIHAIQLVSKLPSDYTSYEVNLVMEDGSRVNVVDHGDLVRIRQDVARLAQFLEVPIWDVG